jgi:integrase
VQRRGGRYYFRVRIPKDLVEAYRRPPDHPRFPGKLRNELVIALDTSDLGEAQIAAHGHSLHTSLEFKRKREELQRQLEKSLGVERADEGEVHESLALAEQRKRIRDVREVTNAIADKVRYSVLRRRLDDDMEFRTDPEKRLFTEVDAEGRGQEIEVLRAAVASGEVEPFKEAALQAALLHGYRVAPDAQGTALLTYGFVQALLQSALLLQEREQGKVVDSEAVVPLARTALREYRSTGTPFSSLVDEWAKRPKLAERPKTIAAYRADMRAFETFLYERNKLWVEDTTNDDWLDFAEHLEKTEKHPKTTRRKLGSVRTVFNYAASRRKLPIGNPCSRVKIEVPESARTPRLAFTREHMRALFSSPVYVDGWRPPRGRGGEAFYWLPLLACWSGAREEELGQLRVEDIDDLPGHGPYMRITDEHPEQRLKSKASRRAVPLHPVLIRCGFLQYVEAQRRRGHEWLFEQLTPDRFCKRTSSFSKLFMRYLRLRLKITDRRFTFHSFRHSFKEACRSCKLPQEAHDALTGHTTPGVGGTYGSYLLAALFEEVAKISYPGLDLTHLYIDDKKGAKRRSKTALEEVS